jgi:hypothetical protein
VTAPAPNPTSPEMKAAAAEAVDNVLGQVFGRSAPLPAQQLPVLTELARVTALQFAQTADRVRTAARLGQAADRLEQRGGVSATRALRPRLQRCERMVAGMVGLAVQRARAAWPDDAGFARIQAWALLCAAVDRAGRVCGPAAAAAVTREAQKAVLDDTYERPAPRPSDQVRTGQVLDGLQADLERAGKTP